MFGEISAINSFNGVKGTKNEKTSPETLESNNWLKNMSIFTAEPMINPGGEGTAAFYG